MISPSFKTKMMWCRFVLFFLCFFSLSCSSTRLENQLKKIPPNDFASQSLEKWGTPFTGIWQDKGLQKYKGSYKGSFSKIYVTPVTLDYVQSSHKQADDLAKYKELGLYLDKELSKDLERDGIRVAKSRKEANLVLELALVKIEPTKTIYHYLSLGTSFFVPYVGSLVSMQAKGEMVLVGKIIEAKSKKPLVVFADYRGDEPSAFGSLRDYTRYGHHYQTLGMWSDKIAALLESRGETKVKAPVWFTISPF